MAVYSTPYYGTRRKALTGESYGPYYGMEFTGGGALSTEDEALPAEVSEKYEATGTPAITETGGEMGGGKALEGLSFANDLSASWGQVAYMAGLPFGTAPPGTAQPKGLTRGILGVAPTIASTLTGIPGIAFTQAVRNFINPLLAQVFPNLFGSAPTGLGGFIGEGVPMGATTTGAAAAGMVTGLGVGAFGGVSMGDVGLEGVGVTGIGPEGIGAEGFGGFD